MSLPSRCLVRRRGGKTAAQRLKAKLRFVGSAARAIVGGGLLIPAAPLKEFLPFCVESYGGLGEEALKLLDLVALEGLSLGASARVTKSQFRSWLSVDWQRHNASIVREWSRRVRQEL